MHRSLWISEAQQAMTLWAPSGKNSDAERLQSDVGVFQGHLIAFMELIMYIEYTECIQNYFASHLMYNKTNLPIYNIMELWVSKA